MLTEQERRFHSYRLSTRRASRITGIWIVANALAYFTGHLIGRGCHHLNQYAHRPHRPFHLFGG